MEDQNPTPQLNPNPAPTPVPSPPPAAPPEPLSKAQQLKSTFLKILIACLLSAAGIAVVTVLVGSFNETLGRALGTIAMVALHALLSFGYINTTERANKKDGGRSIELFSNTVFTLIVLSFITSVFVIWDILSTHLTFDLYLAYGVVLFATLHADVLYRIRKFDKNIDNVVTANYVLMAIVVAMLFIVIFTPESSDLGEFYYRLLAACGIIDATMTLTAIIMHKLFMQKHPELAAKVAENATAKSKNFWKHPLVILLIIYLAFQVIGSVVMLVVGNL